jgi:hypothetical protein
MKHEPIRTQGPQCYENWISFKSGKAVGIIEEFPFFSDSRLIGESENQDAVYSFINPGLREERPGFMRPFLYLRLKDYRDPYRYDLSIGSTEAYHGGDIVDEIAALLSLLLGIRIRAGKATRQYFSPDDQIGRPTAFSVCDFPSFISNAERLVLPSVLGSRKFETAELFYRLLEMRHEAAICLVKAARSYQNALWFSESEPSLTWQLLVTAVETIANCWKKKGDTPETKLRASRPELCAYLDRIKGRNIVPRIAMEFMDSLGSTSKFIGFLVTFLPPPPQNRPPEWVQIEWDERSIKKLLNGIYRHRSKYLHEGIAFPHVICQSPLARIEGKIICCERPTFDACSTMGAVWKKKDMPMFLWVFEYIVRSAIVKWWEEEVKNTLKIP